MIQVNNRNGLIKVRWSQARSRIRLAMMLAAVLALGMAAATACMAQAAVAYADTLGGNGGWARYADGTGPETPANKANRWVKALGGNPWTAFWPSVPAAGEHQASQTSMGEPVAAEVYVWAALLTVGTTSDATGTYSGYMPNVATPDNAGRLQDGTFTYQGVDHKVSALFIQQPNEGVDQLVLGVDAFLPDHLILHVGNDRFPVSASERSVSDGNVHTWRLDRDLGWSAGQHLYVVLLEPSREEVRSGPTALAVETGGSHPEG